MMLMAYLLFTMADTTNKWMTLLGYPALQIAFTRYAFQLVITSAEVSYRGIDRREVTENFWPLLLRAAALASATVANFFALKYLSLSMYSAIMFSAPIFVSLIAWPMLGERVGHWRWFAILAGFIGVLIIVRPFHHSFHWAATLSLYGAIALAFYSLLTRKLVQKVRPHVMQFFAGAFGAVVLLPFAIWFWIPVTPQVWFMMFWVGFTSWAGHEFLTRAHKHSGASVLMPYSYSFILYMTLSGYLFFDELPDWYTALGAVVIIVSGLVIWVREKRLAKHSKNNKVLP